MAIQDGVFDGGGFLDNTSWWSDDERPLDRLLEFVAPGSHLVYEYRPMSQIGGRLGFLEVAPVVGIARYADHHEFITGLHFICRDKKCLLDLDSRLCERRLKVFDESIELWYRTFQVDAVAMLGLDLQTASVVLRV